MILTIEKAKKKPPLSIIGCIWKYNPHITIETNSLANPFTIPDTFHAKFQKIAQNKLHLPTFSWNFLGLFYRSMMILAISVSIVS